MGRRELTFRGFTILSFDMINSERRFSLVICPTILDI